MSLCIFLVTSVNASKWVEGISIGFCGNLLELLICICCTGIQPCTGKLNQKQKPIPE